MIDKAISIQQPWSWLIVNGFKDIENRDWPTRFRGRVLIHAGKKIDAQDEDFYADLKQKGIDFPLGTFDRMTGGIVGEAEIVDCVTASESRWFFGRYGFVIRNARPLPFMPCKGALGFFKPVIEGHTGDD
jgi:hypothetical protein